MEPLPDSHIDAIPVKQPEHVVSEALKHPAAWPEENRIRLTAEDWARLVEKYGSEKVSRYYRLKPNG